MTLHVSVELNVITSAQWCRSELMWLCNLLASVVTSTCFTPGLWSSEKKQSESFLSIKQNGNEKAMVLIVYWGVLVFLPIRRTENPIFVPFKSVSTVWSIKIWTTEKYPYCSSSNKYLPPSSKIAMRSSISLNPAELLIAAVTLWRKSITSICSERSRQQAFICFICLSSCL